MINLWDQKAKWYDFARQIPVVRALYQTELRLLQSLIPEQPIDTHLDIGTGTGSTLAIFHRSRMLILSDRSSRMLRIAIQRHPGPAIVLDLEQGLPFQNQSFDFLTAVGVFEYLREPEFVLRELYRVAKVQAFLLFTTTPIGWFSLLRYFTGNRPRMYREQAVQRMLRSAGWSKIDQRKCKTQDQWLCQKKSEKTPI
ncbi:MAG: class I SAM-dependent methyltransferase [candidate division KSB1 bacterium]|nr:class I SAM-dependent methyltransferase [candidate division KSB1 bacterium]MDQ7064521.1 class I SAM-dependent methyltransferase [candidate division KSB1 bacterium]